MNDNDKVRNELQRLLDEFSSAAGSGGVPKSGTGPNVPGDAPSGLDTSTAKSGGTAAEDEKEFTKEDRKILRRMLIRV